jgi:hypothetical protein
LLLARDELREHVRTSHNDNQERLMDASGRRALRETLAVVGVIGSMAFVGMQIRQSNLQARAAAYHAIGIATSEFHRSFDARLNRLMTESSYPEAVQR